MPKQKTTQTSNQTQTNTFDYKTAPETNDVKALRNFAPATIDASIPFSFAKRRDDYANSFNNPFGAATTPAARESAQRANNAALAQDESVAMQSSQRDADSINYGRAAGLAEMTAPRLVQTGGSSSGTEVKTEPNKLFGDIAQGGAKAALM